jgi:anti-sigma factor RsiW
MDGHLSQDLIFRTLDDELTMPERFECESHLAVCEVCRLQMASLHEFSMRIEAAVHATRGPAMDGVRQQIQKEIEARNLPAPVLQNPAKVMRRFAGGHCRHAGFRCSDDFAEPRLLDAGSGEEGGPSGRVAGRSDQQH